MEMKKKEKQQNTAYSVGWREVWKDYWRDGVKPKKIDHMVKHRAAADEDGGAVFIIILLLPLHVMVQLVEALRYKLEGCRFNYRWCHRNFSLT